MKQWNGLDVLDEGWVDGPAKAHYMVRLMYPNGRYLVTAINGCYHYLDESDEGTAAIMAERSTYPKCGRCEPFLERMRGRRARELRANA